MSCRVRSEVRPDQDAPDATQATTSPGPASTADHRAQRVVSRAPERSRLEPDRPVWAVPLDQSEQLTPLHFVTVPGLVVVILLVAAAVTAGVAALRRSEVVLGVGAVLLVLGLVRLVTYGHGSGLIGGQSSTAALLAGLGMALLGIGVAARPSLGGVPSRPGA